MWLNIMSATKKTNVFGFIYTSQQPMQCNKKSNKI